MVGARRAVCATVQRPFAINALSFPLKMDIHQHITTLPPGVYIAVSGYNFLKRVFTVNHRLEHASVHHFSNLNKLVGLFF